MSSMLKKTAAGNANETVKTLYDRGKRAPDLLALERGTRAVLDPVSSGSIAPRAAFTSAATVAPRTEWRASHEAIRLEAENR